MWLPPGPPDQAERDALEEQARAMREEYDATRPARLAVLATGPALRDINKAADCRCSCHPSPASQSLHEGGATCPCQLTKAERAELWDRLLEPLDEAAEASKQDDDAREVVDEAVRTGGGVIITRHGKPVAVLLAHNEYESLIETVNILSDDETMAALAESEADFAAGNFLRIDQI